MLGMAENSLGYEECGNCQIPFQKKSSKVTRIMVGNDDQSEEDIISIYEALSVIFEISPLMPSDTNDRVDGNRGSLLTKKGAFRNGSLFRKPTTRNNDNSDNGYGICVECSEVLKALYKCFQCFTKACKLDSEIGKILKCLEGKRELTRQGNGPGETSFNERVVVVKAEPLETDGQQELDDQEDQQENDYDNDPAENLIEAEIGVQKVSPPTSESDSDDDGDLDMRGACSPGAVDLSENDEEQNMPPVTKNLEGKRILRDRKKMRPIIESDDDEVRSAINDEDFTLPKPKQPSNPVKRRYISGATGHGITQLKCPTCNKEFLHESTLICHRRIIHRESVKIRPPPPLPQMKLTNQGNTDRLKALADANDKTSACPICRLEVPRTEIRHHLSTHTRSLSKPWLCTICGTNFKNEAGLSEHAKAHIYGIPCKRCGKKIPALEMLNHIRQCVVKPGQPLDYSCKICGIMFEKISELIEHRAKVHGHFWKCKLCGIKFRQRDKMQKHMNTHKQKKLHKCKICDKSFDRIDVLRLHIKRFHRNNEGPPSVQRSVALETGNDNFGPDFPDHDFSPAPSPLHAETNQPNLQENPTNKMPPKEKESSTVAKPSSNVDFSGPVLENRFVCKGCTYTFPKASELDAHLVETHTDKESFLCKICNRRLQDDYCLKLHVKTHGEMKPLECYHPDCGKIYRDKNTFFYHLKEKHGMEIKSIIAKYPDVFRQTNKDYSSRYIQKMKSGPGQKETTRGKFPCEVCGRIFTQIYALKNHVRLVHDKVKDYLCKYCGKAFARKSYFMLHEKLHTSNEAPYKCHLCNKGFRLPGNLRMHLRSTIHNPNKDFVCDVCGKGFNRNDNLRLHVKTVHMKIPLRKSKSEASDRYTHGGRNRIYIGSKSDNDNKRENPASNSDANFGTPSSGPIPGTSHSFFGQQGQQQENIQHFSSGSAFQRHPGMLSHMDSSSMDSSSHLSGDGGDSSRHSELDIGHNRHDRSQHDARHSNIFMPMLALASQDERGSADAGHHQQFSQADYNLRGYQYR